MISAIVFSFELQSIDLGKAALNNGNALSYRSINANVLLYGGEYQARQRREGFRYYGRLGLGKLSNDSNEFYTQENSYHLLFGGGLEYALKNRLAGRLELISYDTDAHYIGVQLLYRIGRNRTAPVNDASAYIKPTPAVSVPAVALEQPLVVEHETFDSVFFDLSSSELDEEDKIKLNDVAVVLKNNGLLRVNLVGYADESGPADYNLRLSQERSTRILKWLEAQGVPSSQLSASALGETSEFGYGFTPEVLARNRRVNIVRAN